QNRSGDRRHLARHIPAFDASNLLLAIQDRHESSSRPAATSRSLSPFIFSRSYDLAGVCARWLAFTARVIISRNSQRYCDVLDHAPACQSRSQRTPVRAQQLGPAVVAIIGVRPIPRRSSLILAAEDRTGLHSDNLQYRPCKCLGDSIFTS